jgi:hypothetical protein
MPMSSKLLNKLAAPETWFNLCGLLAFIGIAMMLIGQYFKIEAIIILGRWLSIPLVICALITLFVFLPVILISNLINKK